MHYNNAVIIRFRKEWSKAGKKRIIELELSPKQQAEKIHKLLLQAGGTGG